MATNPNWRPRIRRLGVPTANMFGSLGTITRITGHYTAGPRDKNWRDAVRLWRIYAEQHRRQGWGGIGYHYGITIGGNLVLLRPVGWKGAHTGGNNTGNIGIVVHGTTGHRATKKQMRTLRWLLANAHTSAMPASHRTPRSLAGIRVYGHNDWMATACPGQFKPFFTSKGKRR